MPFESQVATKEDLGVTEQRLAQTEQRLSERLHGVELSVERLRSSMFRWLLMFFVPRWVGVYGTLVAILFCGVN